MASERSAAARVIVEDLQRVFGERLQAVVVYGWHPHTPVPTLALVTDLSVEDLNACANHVGSWHRAGAGTPLLLRRRDFERSLDAFPIEYGEILHHHELAFGRDPFAGLAIKDEDLRRACEVQVKSHLLHLREDYIESRGHLGEVEALVRESAPGFAALLRQLARLDEFPYQTRRDLVDYAESRARLDARVVGDLLALADAETSVDTAKIFPSYLAVVERLADFVDEWRAV
jgi:hypothetical protein